VTTRAAGAPGAKDHFPPDEQFFALAASFNLLISTLTSHITSDEAYTFHRSENIAATM
jgi:hypothetical protein